jgi:hypothetical protein
MLSQAISSPLNAGWHNANLHVVIIFMIDEKIKIKCSKCSQVFRERAQKVRDGFQTNCLHCNRLITFVFGSEDSNIRRALRNAKETRYLIEAARAAKLKEAVN